MPRDYTPGLHTDGTIDVECWCREDIVAVPLAEFRAGRTGSCRERCKPPEKS